MLSSAVTLISSIPVEMQIAFGSVAGVGIAILGTLFSGPVSHDTNAAPARPAGYVPVQAAAPVKLMPARAGANKAIKAKRLLTGNETEFWTRLRRALPDFEVAPQVSMGAIMDSVRPGDWGVISQFRGKICDFAVVCRRTGSVKAVIELDDRTHDARKDRARDALVAAVGIPTIRFESKAKPSAQDIQTAFRVATTPMPAAAT